MTVEAEAGRPGKASRKPARGTKGMRLIRVPRSGRASASYLALAAAYPIRPLRSEEDLDEAIAVLDRLLSRRKPLDPQEQDYRDSLSHEIERYEAAAHPMPAVSDAALLKHLIEAREVTLSAVAAAADIAVSTLSSVLTGKRRLNRSHIAKLASYFGVEPGVFLSQPPGEP
jgi:HTH-type transcriptional regulator/antitoxin HigA